MYNKEDSKKKSKYITPNTMKINFSNKSLIQKMKKMSKGEDPNTQPKFKKFHNSTVNLAVNKKTSTSKQRIVETSGSPKRKRSLKSRKKT